MSEMPFNSEAERVVLACLLINPDIWPQLKLVPGDFHIDRNRIVCRAISRLQGKEIDANTVADALTDEELKDIGGVSYISQILTYCPEPTGTEERATEIEGLVMADLLREFRERRKLVKAAVNMARIAFDIETPLRQL